MGHFFASLFYGLRRKKPTDFLPVVLITGCSSGIGLALARMMYTKSSYRVVVTARHIEKLQSELPETDRFWVRNLDITKSEDRVRVIKEISSRWKGVNILVNNAGISYRSVVEHMTEADEFLQMDTNYLGPVALIRLALPHMRKIGRGKIINVSSVSGMLAMPTMSSYSASKYALEGASEALWYEAKPFGVDVSLIQPGFIRSDSFANVRYSEEAKFQSENDGPYHDYYENMTPFIRKLMGASRTTPEDIAKLILKIIQTENPPLWIPATIDASLFYYLRRLLPRRFLLPLLFQLLPRASHWGKSHSKKRHL